MGADFAFTMTNADLGTQSRSHKSLRSWVDEMEALCNPAKVFWCDGSDAEYRSVCEQMVKSGSLTPLNEKKRPGCFLARSHPSDVARVENRTYICSQSREQAGPTNN